MVHTFGVDGNCIALLPMQVICVIAGGGIFRFLKGIPPLKDQWGYAFTVATIAFHLFIVTAYIDPERWTLPMLRFSMILFGFTLATVVNIAIQPIYAGDALHKLVAKNFETAAYVFKRYTTPDFLSYCLEGCVGSGNGGQACIYCRIVILCFFSILEYWPISWLMVSSH